LIEDSPKWGEPPRSQVRHPRAGAGSLLARALRSALELLGSDSLAGRDLTPYRANRAGELPEPAIGNHCRTPRWRSRCSRLAPYTRAMVGSRGIIWWIPDGERILEGGESAHSRETTSRCFKVPSKGGSAFASLQDPLAAVHAAWTDSPQEGMPFQSGRTGLLPGPIGSAPLHRPRGRSPGLTTSRLAQGLPTVRDCRSLLLDQGLADGRIPACRQAAPRDGPAKGSAGRAPRLGHEERFRAPSKLISAIDRLY
jgi:hypothetical protein